MEHYRLVAFLILNHFENPQTELNRVAFRCLQALIDYNDDAGLISRAVSEVIFTYQAKQNFNSFARFGLIFELIFFSALVAFILQFGVRKT